MLAPVDAGGPRHRPAGGGPPVPQPRHQLGQLRREKLIEQDPSGPARTALPSPRFSASTIAVPWPGRARPPPSRFQPAPGQVFPLSMARHRGRGGDQPAPTAHRIFLQQPQDGCGLRCQPGEPLCLPGRHQGGVACDTESRIARLGVRSRATRRCRRPSAPRAVAGLAQAPVRHQQAQLQADQQLTRGPADAAQNRPPVWAGPVAGAAAIRAGAGRSPRRCLRAARGAHQPLRAGWSS